MDSSGRCFRSRPPSSRTRTSTPAARAAPGGWLSLNAVADARLDVAAPRKRRAGRARPRPRDAQDGEAQTRGRRDGSRGAAAPPPGQAGGDGRAATRGESKRRVRVIITASRRIVGSTCMYTASHPHVTSSRNTLPFSRDDVRAHSKTLEEEDVSFSHHASLLGEAKRVERRRGRRGRGSSVTSSSLSSERCATSASRSALRLPPLPPCARAPRSPRSRTRPRR